MRAERNRRHGSSGNSAAGPSRRGSWRWGSRSCSSPFRTMYCRAAANRWASYPRATARRRGGAAAKRAHARTANLRRAGDRRRSGGRGGLAVSGPIRDARTRARGRFQPEVRRQVHRGRPRVHADQLRQRKSEHQHHRVLRQPHPLLCGGHLCARHLLLPHGLRQGYLRAQHHRAHPQGRRARAQRAHHQRRFLRHPRGRRVRAQRRAVLFRQGGARNRRALLGRQPALLPARGVRLRSRNGQRRLSDLELWPRDAG